MAKLLLMSLIVATATIPALLSADSKPHRGLARAIRAMLVFNVVYLLAVVFVYPKIAW